MLSEFRGHHCQHRSDDFPIIRYLVRDVAPNLVVELGTDRGGFAAMLAAHVRAWGGRVITFDIERKFAPSLLTEYPNIEFVEADILAQPHPYLVDVLGEDCVFLYCDNGNKQREVQMYANYLRRNSLLGVHDYNIEIKAEWVEPYVAALGFIRHGHARFETLRNEWYPEPMTRLWRRTLGDRHDTILDPDARVRVTTED